jgi:2-methylisocitrate lyase-like PEP mutase family enzyme
MAHPASPGPAQQEDRATRFRDLHIAGRPLLLFNVWDVGSAKVVADAGAQAIATSSWSVAAAHGYPDGEQLPFRVALANARSIAAAVNLPVSVDIEAGYGSAPDAVAASVRDVIATGAIGFNLEDQDIARGALYPIRDQSRRICAARTAADAKTHGAFVNARTDVFLNAEPTTHDERVLDEAVRRAEAYASAGADGLFAPGLRNASLIETLCRRCPLPVNIMVVPQVPTPERLAALGVARISHGPEPYRVAMQSLAQAAQRAYGA